MCYSGKCIYENYMGECVAPSNMKNACRKGHRISVIKSLMYNMKCNVNFITHRIKCKFSKKYRDKFDDLPF